MKLPSGNNVSWSAESFDGKTGKAIINGKQFNLADGQLFLVVLEKGQVTQLKRDLSKVKADEESLKRLADSDEDISRFLQHQLTEKD